MPATTPADPRPGRIDELTRSECFGLLAGGIFGRIAVVDDHGPVIFPVSFVLDRHSVVFRTEPGTKLHAARRGSRVCFEADGTDAAGRTAWSVIVHGEITEVTDPAELARLRTLPRLEATFDLVRRGRDGLHVTGRVTATVGQTCVITLEPLPELGVVLLAERLPGDLGSHRAYPETIRRPVSTAGRILM